MPTPTRTLDDIIRDFVQIDENTGCWLWTGEINRLRGNYPHVSIRNRTRRAHRVIYEGLVGPIAPGLQLDHLCRVRHCVNPEHLEPVTAAENLRRARAAKPAKTTCPEGHPWVPENLVSAGAEGRMRCRTCSNRASAARLAANRDRINAERRQHAALRRQEVAA